MLIFICFGLGYGRMRDSKIRVGVGFGFFRGDYIPKGSSFTDITQDDIQAIEDKINHRPRKNLGWKTPYEVFYGVEIVD